MIYSVNCTALSSALEELKIIVKNNEEKGLKTVIFCEDRLTLAGSLLPLPRSLSHTAEHHRRHRSP